MMRVTALVELQQEIFKRLPKSSLYACALTCKGWSSLALDYLWRDMRSAISLFLSFEKYKWGSVCLACR
jgi:hypothetical protein